MIHDSLANCATYRGLGSAFAKAFDWLSSTDLASLAEGRVDIAGPSGAEVYALVQRYVTEPATGRSFETHRRYADIQVVLSGSEVIGYRQAAALEESSPYDADKDFALQKLSGAIDLVVGPGEFAIFLPQDAHAPKLLAQGKAVEVRKIVVKVRVAE